MNDGAYKVILNTKGSVGEISPELKAVLDYFDGKEPTDDYTKELDKMVKVGRMNKEWQVEYMQAWMYELEQQKIGKEEAEANILKKMLKRGDSQESILELGYSLEDIKRVKAQM